MLFVRFFRVNASISLALDNKSTLTCRHKPLKNSCKLFRDLLEGSLNGFVLALIQVSNQLLDRFLRLVKLLAPLEELILLGREAVVLFKSLLVDVLVLLQRVVDLLQP